MLLLLQHPECLQRVLAEQCELLSGIGALEYDCVYKMDYLQNCIKESIRLFPPNTMAIRRVLNDIEIPCNNRTFTIRKGEDIVSAIAVQCRMESIFKNANAFEPDRFGSERNEQKIPFSFIGFGAGRHACLGQQLGLLQMKTTMSVLLRNFTFKVVDAVLPEPDYAFMVVKPKGPCQVRYTRHPDSMINKK